MDVSFKVFPERVEKVERMRGHNERVFSFYFLQVFEAVNALQFFFFCVENKDMCSFDSAFCAWNEGDFFFLGVGLKVFGEVSMIMKGECCRVVPP